MIRDPFDNTETPYEILNLEPDVSNAEVHNALAKFVRVKKNLSKLGIANEAIRKLRNPLERLEVDYFYYTFNNIIESDEIKIQEFDKNILTEVTVPTYRTSEFYSDLEIDNYEEEYSEIKIININPAENKVFLKPDKIKMDVKFDI